MNFFETALVDKGQLVRSDYHLNRVRETFKYLNISPIVDDQPLEIWQELRLKAVLHHWQDKAIRIDFIKSDDQWKSHFTPRTPRMISGPLRIKIVKIEKRCERELQQRAYKWDHWQREMSAKYPIEDTFDDVLLVDHQGFILETLRANIFLKREEKLYTPPIELGILKGTYRQWLIDQGQACIRPIRLSELKPSDSLYLSNALIGQVPAIIVS